MCEEVWERFALNKFFHIVFMFARYSLSINSMQNKKRCENSGLDLPLLNISNSVNIAAFRQQNTKIYITREYRLPTAVRLSPFCVPSLFI